MKRLIETMLGRLFGEKEQAAPQPERRAELHDPLDVVSRTQRWEFSKADPIQRTVNDFPFAESLLAQASVGDSADTGAVSSTTVMDSSDSPISAKFNSSYAVPDQLQNWFMSQSFIGYQACALIAQHWLVDKACSMAGEDAIRNGWDLNAVGDDELSKEDYDRMREFDVIFKLKENLKELNRFKNVFGIRIAMFKVESNDPKYYEKPFNIDGVTEDSYRGISQIDPYWMTPVMTSSSTTDPSSIHFYDPEFWVINGKRYHRSHLIIIRGPQPADVLKPTYIFGGIPMTQRIYERVYAAERTANEAPLLALSKRTTSLHVDVEKAITQQSKFEEKLAFWVKYRDNHAVKVLGKDENIEQFDTNLSDFDSIIMNQYQLVAAISKVPATKLLGTSPKGFNATGDFELISYHEELESIQEHDMSPLLSRHYDILGRSLGIKAKVQVVFEPVDSVTSAQQAEINAKKATTAQAYVTMGAVSPDEVREALRDDKKSDFNRLTDEGAEEEPGMSPENLARFQEAGAEEDKGEASQMAATAKVQQVEGQPAGAPQEDGEDEGAPVSMVAANKPKENTSIPAQTSNEKQLAAALEVLTARLQAVEALMTAEGVDLPKSITPSIARSVKPSVTGLEPTVSGVGAVMPQMDPAKQPKMRMAGLLLSIENPRGTIRQGMGLDGQMWSVKMPHHYGFIKGTVGADGDEVDCFVGKNLASDKVFVINQLNPEDESFDEHKCMLGFDDEASAKAAYDSSYSAGWKGFGDMVEMTMDEFKEWLAGDGDDPVAMDDAGKFKEELHPRAKNGQFGKGGSSAASTSKPAKAKLGSKKDALPNLAKSITEANNGKAPTPKEFHDKAVEMGFEIIPAQSVKYLKMYLKTQKEGESKDKPKEEKQTPQQIQKDHKEESKEIAEKNAHGSPASMVTVEAVKAGYQKEGTYNGIDYYKANGKKISYKPETDTWLSMDGSGVKAQGEGLKTLLAHLKDNPAGAATANTNTASPKPTPQTASHSTTTATAKAYGHHIPAEKFSYSKHGIADDKALPPRVKESITAYKGSSYKSINNALRFHDSFDPSEVSPTTMAHILNLQRAFAQVAPSKKTVTVGRKVDIEALKTMAKDAGLKDLSDLKAGMTLRDTGIVSTSHSASVWNGNVKFEIDLPKGSKAIDISETAKLNQSEQEVLLPPNSKFVIKEVNTGEAAKGFTYHIKCEFIPH